MLRQFHCRCIGLLLAAASCTAAAAEEPYRAVYLNGFRNPSIGVEYREGAVSIHTGYYPTILSDERDEEGDTQSFVRTGFSVWYGQRWYGSLSHLYGLDGPREELHFVIGEVGIQFIVWSRIALRLGVAVIPESHGFETAVNPTPGISLRIPLAD